jgi:hypothetical protein
VLTGRQRRGGFDRVDAHDRAPQPHFVRTHSRGEISKRRLGAELAAQLFARGFELPPLAPHAPGPRVASQRVDHGATDAALRERLELDASRFVEPAGGVDEANHAVLDQIVQLDRVRHRGGDPARKRFDERQTGGNTVPIVGGEWLTLHDSCPPAVAAPMAAAPSSATGVPSGKRQKGETRSDAARRR